VPAVVVKEVQRRDPVLTGALQALAPGMVIQYQAGRVHRALCLEPVGSEGIPGMPSGRSSIVQTSPAKYNPFLRSALSLNTKFVNNFFYSKK